MTFKPSALKATLTSLVALSALMPVSACDLAQNQLKMDRATNSEVQDYRDALAPREVSMTEGSGTVGEDGGLELQPYVSDVSETMKAMPLVSISINQSIPLREALFELSKQANYDVELDPRIAGSIIFTARNRPFDVVIDRICEIAGLRYKLDGDTLRIELDTPYSQNYKIDYLGMIRKSKSSLDNSVSLTTSGDGGGPTGGSSFKVESSSDADFWAELDTNLKQILASNASGSYLKTEEDPAISLTASNPVSPPVPPIDESALKEGSATATVPPQAGANVSSPMSIPAAPPSAAAPSAPPAGAPSVAPSDPAAAAGSAATAPSSPAPDAQAVGEKAAPAPTQTVLRVESLPTAASSGGQSANRNAVEFTPTYSINKQAGIVSVYANERLHKKVAEYFDELRRSTSSQVLIEAKVLEVRLTDEYAAGIDWTFLDHLGDLNALSFVSRPIPGMSPTSTSLMSVGFVGTDLSAFVDALSRFGTVQALASPRLTVLNNQSAALNVAENKVYFEVDLTSTTTGSPPSTEVTVDSTVHTVPEGVLINVMPSIDLAKNSISLQVRPTVTKITEYIDDPAVAFAVAGLPAGSDASGITSQIPVVNVQEVDSVVKMGSGQMIVMGGLLQDASRSSSDSIPVLGEVPVVGNLFRNQGDKVTKSELVIFLKATILNDAGESVHQTDKDIYRVFGQDRRPGKL